MVFGVTYHRDALRTSAEGRDASHNVGVLLTLLEVGDVTAGFGVNLRLDRSAQYDPRSTLH